MRTFAQVSQQPAVFLRVAFPQPDTAATTGLLLPVVRGLVYRPGISLASTPCPQSAPGHGRVVSPRIPGAFHPLTAVPSNTSVSCKRLNPLAFSRFKAVPRGLTNHQPSSLAIQKTRPEEESRGDRTRTCDLLTPSRSGLSLVENCKVKNNSSQRFSAYATVRLAPFSALFWF